MGIFSVMMYYMMVSLMNNDGIRKMPYSDNILALLPIGLWVARIFIVVFLFYINSFLMKSDFTIFSAWKNAILQS